MNVSSSPFGSFDGRDVDLFTLTNDHGMVVKITNYGGTVTSMVTPDASGQSSDIVCGFDTLEGYLADAYRANSPYFGCLVGRYAGRIKDGKFSTANGDYQVATNDGSNHIHGGIKGFDKRVWDATGGVEDGDAVLTLHLTSPDGEEGYPGNLAVTVEYRLNNANELRISYRATTDQATPVALTNHTYFNLSAFAEKVWGHVVQLHSDRYLVPDETNVPVGEEADVTGTAADFRFPKRLGDCLDELPMGFEHFYVWGPGSVEPIPVAKISEPASGRVLEVLTTEPGGLFYTGRYTSDELKRESGAQFGQFRGFCVETAGYPNGPNIAGAPKCVLEPGETYQNCTVYRVSWA